MLKWIWYNFISNFSCEVSIWFHGTWTLNQYKDVMLPVWKTHCGDKGILRLSYLHNGISYTGKTTSLYWIWALDSITGENLVPLWCITHCGLMISYQSYSRFVPSQWEMVLLCNSISHWLSASLESALYMVILDRGQHEPMLTCQVAINEIR